ncbi:MAG: OB-fold nucleic acid binding domain-containing protein [Nanoarchaeota archaeon]|nr:OB-fold nucleic acid binding domain-containing protein [Nanoarchaeota archaeon]
MPEQQFKRNTAYKLRIGDILIGKPVINEEKFAFLELGDKKIVRVNIIGNIVDKYESEGERKYVFLTLDDGSGQIKLKAFGDDLEKFKSVVQGQTVTVIGVLRNWNDETYIAPEIISEQDPKYLLLRKLETEKEKAATAKPIEKEEIMAIKDNLLELVKNSEENGGIETEEVLQKFSEISPSIINQEIKRLLEEGIIFEPRPGKVRYLG